MDGAYPSAFRTAVTAIAVCFSFCASAAPTEHVRTETSRADIESALARVDTVRSSSDADSLALETALNALGGAYLEANQYASAEAAYSEALVSAEQHGGRESERVIAPLAGMGATFSRSGHHEDAIPILQRVVTIMRAQYGMFDLRQQHVLEALAASLTALHREPEAQDLMVYRVRAAEKTYGEGSPKVIPWLCDLGNWFAETGKTREARMTFYVALNIVGATELLSDPIIVEPLRGIARAYMLRSSYPDAWLRPRSPPGCSMPGVRCKGPFRMDSDGKPIVLPRTLNQEGEHALHRALRILESDPDSPEQTRIETLLQMGDWYQIKKSPREALSYYQRAWQLIRATPSLPDSAATALNVPVRVYYPTPQLVAHVPTAVAAIDTQSHYVQMEFTVAADGSVRDARVLDHDTRDRYAQDILDAVRASRFRPKFVDGQPVAATGVTYRETFWTGKPRD
jgi:tetratricopeptide (TPR) repeat protein